MRGRNDARHGVSLATRLTPRPLRRSRARRLSGLAPTARIFGIGLSRTGTSSLIKALEVLGCRSLHFPADETSRGRIMTFLADGGERLRLPILERFDAAADSPICASFEALDVAYPGSKFILTAREREAWLDSCQVLWARYEAYRLQHRDDPFTVYIDAICDKLYGGAIFDRARFSRAYERYHDRVREQFRGRSGDLLTFEICAGAGWGPLCEFLHLPQPRSPFPWINAREPAD